jgi:hypothetical protein
VDVFDQEPLPRDHPLPQPTKSAGNPAYAPRPQHAPLLSLLSPSATFVLRTHGRNGGNNDVEGVAEPKVSKPTAARAPLSVVKPTSFGLCRNAPG